MTFDSEYNTKLINFMHFPTVLLLLFLFTNKIDFVVLYFRRYIFVDIFFRYIFLKPGFMMKPL